MINNFIFFFLIFFSWKEKEKGNQLKTPFAKAGGNGEKGKKGKKGRKNDFTLPPTCH